MEITTTEQGDVTVVSIRGSIDSMNAEQLSAAFAAWIAKGRVRLVADFAAVTYTSSAGLRSLLGAVKDSRRRGGDLRIAAMQPQVERVLSISGFTSIIQTFGDRDGAVHSFKAVA